MGHFGERVLELPGGVLLGDASWDVPGGQHWQEALIAESGSCVHSFDSSEEQ